MTKRMLIMLIAVGVVFGGIFGFQAFKARMIKKFMTAGGEPTQTVSTAQAAYQQWQSQIEAVGTLGAVRGVDLAPEVAGLVSAIRFESGDDVKAGTLLLEMRADADIATLDALRAAADLAEANYKRDLEQFKVQAISQATLDSDAATLKGAKAQVAAQEAAIDKKRIRAPFSGRLGIRAVDLGQYLNAGTKIVTLQALDPIFVDFYVPQSALAQLAIGQHVTARTDTYPDESFAGAVTAISPKVDVGTRNVQVRASLRNPEHRLLPGMFATVSIDAGAPQRHITLPTTAITYNPYGDTVFLVTEKGKDKEGKPRLVAQQKFVTVGPTRGDQVAVLQGVGEGDTVVTSGQLKLRNGSPIAVNNTIQPSSNPAPKPVDR
jgi:membrane fusion protein, multidrug efflux system